jgi:hypothetical protein
LLREALSPYPQFLLSTPAEPLADQDVVLLMGLPSTSPPDQGAAQRAADNALRAQLQTLSLPYRVVHGQGAVGLSQALLALGLPAPDVPTQTVREQAQYDLNRGRTPWSCETCSDPECEHRLFTGLLGR